MMTTMRAEKTPSSRPSIIATGYGGRNDIFGGAVFDHAVSVFLDDLRDRGLEDTVLLVATGEMGRTPKVNNDGGRSYWNPSAPLLLAGGGFQMGPMIGRTTSDGGKPATETMTVERLHAAILHTLLDVGQMRVE